MTRLHEVERTRDVKFNWRPFNARAIMVEQGNRPFVGKPVKTAYIWRDIERRAGGYRIPLRVPVSYPLKQLERTNLVAVLGWQQGWCAAYTTAAYRGWFQDGLEPGSEPNLSNSLREIGQNRSRVIAQAEGDEIRDALGAATDEARSVGIFGSPTFVVGGEIFRGDDRMDDALTWHRSGTLSRAG